MTPDQDARYDRLEARVGRLEERQAAHHQRLITLEAANAAGAGTAVTVALLTGKVDALSTDVDELAQSIVSRDSAATAERRSLRLALLSLSGVIIAALIAGAAAVIAAGIHP